MLSLLLLLLAPDVPCEPATIAAVRGKYEAWRGRCVRLRGIAKRGRLYADRKAMREPRELWGEDVRRSIVLYSLPPGLPERTAYPAEVVGTIGSCADQHAVIAAEQTNSPNDIIMVGGYCHTSMEVYIQPSSVRRLPR
jgi:hypothetical protein